MKEEFIENLLPNVRLSTFFKQVKGREDTDIPDEELIKFYFEHELRLGFVRYIELLK
jgi:hypothetical protein